MRLRAQVLLSTLAVCPLAWFTLNATGDSRVPPQPASANPKTTGSNAQTSIAQAARPVAPETLRNESTPRQNPALDLRAASVAAPLNWVRVPLSQPISIRDAIRPEILERAIAISSGQRAIAMPERSSATASLPWDRIVARSIGLDDDTVARVSRVAPANLPTPAVPNPTPAVAAPETLAAIDRRLDQPAIVSEVTIPQTAIPQTAIAQTTIAQTTIAQAAVAQPAAPTLPSAIDQSYRLGAGDSIQVNFFNVPEYSGPQRILVDGTINMPVVGSVSVSGLTLAEAERAIAAAYSGELRNIRISVGLTQARPVRIGVAGEVRQPGYYVMPGSDTQPASVAQAIQAAGGATQIADLRQIQVRRVGSNGVPQLMTVNLWALLEQGDLSQNVTLLDGDTIVIAPATSISAAETEQLAASNLASSAAQSINVALVGEVGRPGAYRLDSTAGNRPTLTQAIQAAGGIRPEANLREVVVQRSARNGTIQTARLDLWQIVTTGDLSQDLVLQPGDRITIAKAEAMSPEEMVQATGSNLASETIRVNIAGEATSPGAIEVPANATLNQALLAAGGLNRRARQTVQLIRINPNGSLTQRRIEVDFEQGLDPENNPILFNNDVVIVGRNGLASIGDTASNILEPIFRILPFFTLFQSF